MHVPFHGAIGPRRRQCGLHGSAVSTETIGQRDEGRQVARLCSGQPGRQRRHVPICHQPSESLEQLVGGLQEWIIGKELVKPGALRRVEVLGRTHTQPADLDAPPTWSAPAWGIAGALEPCRTPGDQRLRE